MNWSRITSLETWEGLALEARWKVLGRRGRNTFTPTWPLTERELEDTQIRWPIEYDWAPAGKWVEPLVKGLRRYVTVEKTTLVQPFKRIVLIQVIIRGKSYDVAIDYSDLPDVDESCARRCPLYFKMQFSRGGYSLSHIVPGGFVPNSNNIYDHLPQLRRHSRQKSYRYDVYGRFGLEFARDIRRKACSLLSAQNYFQWEGSLHIKRYSLALREIANSKICIDLPGKGDFCFRLVDYFAVGACVIAPKHGNELLVPLIDREHIVYARNDLSDLIDLCRFYLANDDLRETLIRNSKLFFDKYLHRDQLAAYYLRSCLDRLA